MISKHPRDIYYAKEGLGKWPAGGKKRKMEENYIKKGEKALKMHLFGL